MTQVESTPPASSARPADAPERYRPQHKIRLVTATSLFDGHDASINIMRRIAQAAGAEVIHLGHNRAAGDVVDAAVQEDAQAVALTSYQGGHMEYFRYVKDLLAERGCDHVKIFGGGGGVILPDEIEALHRAGITRIYSPDDGRALGLTGMIDDMLRRCDFANGGEVQPAALSWRDPRSVAVALSVAENSPQRIRALLEDAAAPTATAPVLGITGTGGAGKSSLIDELVRRYLLSLPDATVAVLSIDPSRRKTGGALLGDRIRMNAVTGPRAFMRSMATRQANLALAGCVPEALRVLRHAGFDLIVLETSGIGQSDTEIVDFADVTLYVMTPEYGAPTQLEKIDMLDFADVVAINKFDRRGAEDALRDVRKQWRRNRNEFATDDAAVPVLGTKAHHFGDPGTDRLFDVLMERLAAAAGGEALGSRQALPKVGDTAHQVIPPARTRYLAEIAEHNRRYRRWVEEQSAAARRAWQIEAVRAELAADSPAAAELERAGQAAAAAVDPECQELLAEWPQLVESYRGDFHRFTVRGRDVEVRQRHTTLSGLDLPKVALPGFADAGERLRWLLSENVPGRFPFAAGVYPFKREGEEPTRMFAGEGGPETTNRRFHYLAAAQPAKRLSTAFDSVTLYGEDPHRRPDIYGKIGNAGVSICSLDDAKRLYSGFDLADPRTSVSMTINGPAPMLLAFFLNAAVDQACEKWLHEQGRTGEVEALLRSRYDDRGRPRPSYRGERPAGNDGLGLLLLGVTGDEVLPREVYAKIRDATLRAVRGTVQADILKEDQAQNTCIFSTEFALRMMGDVQQWFIDHGVRNFYSVSISGYHIAEAGANPITQLALTLANGFTYVEYYRARGMAIDDFAPNLSFFFSNGVDAEYAVIGRVARRIWAKAMKHLYGGNSRSQMLKYHIQTSGRSLHAQEIDFNDIRTTLQALYAIYDNCNSLHTNAYDEAITTPTEASVRRAVAIQLIINRELGLARNENPLQGSFIIEELSDLVEEAVMVEFERLAERGGVLGAMETMYQRAKIQEESLLYETLKSTGELPIIGVNTFLDDAGSPIITPAEVRRSTDAEKEAQIEQVATLHSVHGSAAGKALAELRRAAIRGDNVFDRLMTCARVCTLGQITDALYAVGGQYRRNM